MSGRCLAVAGIRRHLFLLICKEGHKLLLFAMICKFLARAHPGCRRQWSKSAHRPRPQLMMVNDALRVGLLLGCCCKLQHFSHFSSSHGVEVMGCVPPSCKAKRKRNDYDQHRFVGTLTTHGALERFPPSWSPQPHTIET